MDMRIGFATWTMGDTPFREYAPLLARMGYHGIEIVGDDLPLSVEELQRVLQENNLQVLAVASGHTADPAHPLPSQRQRSIEHYRRLLELCVTLGCRRFVLREKIGRTRPIVGRTKEWTLFQQTLSSLIQSAASLDVQVSVLPINRYEGYLLNRAEEALEVIRHQHQHHLSIALNSYHMNIEEASIAGAVKRVGPHLGLFYAAESHRRVLGEGRIDWPELCLALKSQGYQGDFIVECQAPGADPLMPVGRAADWPARVLEYAQRSIDNLRVALAAVYS